MPRPGWRPLTGSIREIKAGTGASWSSPRVETKPILSAAATVWAELREIIHDFKPHQILVIPNLDLIAAAVKGVVTDHSVTRGIPRFKPFHRRRQ